MARQRLELRPQQTCPLHQRRNTMNAVIESPVKLSLSRSFDAPPETLFDAWLQDSWSDWLGPEGVVCLSCEIDPRVGGKWRIVSRMPDGREVTMSGVYQEISRATRL